MISAPISRWISIVLALLWAAPPVVGERAKPALPPLVFVSRNPSPRGPLAIPGIGPRQHAFATGGRLLLLSSNGRMTPLVSPRTFYDVSGPDVSWDGRRVVFAATVGRDSAWRIYSVGRNGRGLRALTRSDRGLDLTRFATASPPPARYDDLDPCWLPDGRVCFASTRYPQTAELGGGPATNLFVVDADGHHLTRITSERNGAEQPTIDPVTGRIVYSRWWFNRYLPSDVEPSGVTIDRGRALPADSVNLWQAITIRPDGEGLKLAGGNPRVRAETMVYQPLVLADGTLIGVRAERSSLLPDGRHLSLQEFPGGFAEPRRLVGGDGRSSACAPAVLPDGRILFSYDPKGSGNFGLYAMGRGRRGITKILDLPGKLELDAAVLAPRKRPPILEPAFMDLPRTVPVADEKGLHDGSTTFRFDCLNVFTNAAVDAPFPDAPPLSRDLRIRFYASLSRPASPGGDTVILVRESRVGASGAVHEHDLPADTPMFEQLIDAHGHVLRSASGPTHVPGFNAGRFGSGTKCVGCHIGHSAIPVAPSGFQGRSFNTAPSAEVRASSVADGTAGARAAVDRRAKGPVDRVAWVAASNQGESIRLSWQSPIELDAIVLYPISLNSSDGTDLRVQRCELKLFLNGREVERNSVDQDLAPAGTRVDLKGVTSDALEVSLTRTVGRIQRKPRAGLAEIETIGRLTEGLTPLREHP